MFHPDIGLIVRRLVELGIRGVIRGDSIVVDGDERSAVIRPLIVEKHWYAGDQRVEIWGGADWHERVAEDVVAWVERGEVVHRDLPIRRRR